MDTAGSSAGGYGRHTTILQAGRRLEVRKLCERLSLGVALVMFHNLPAVAASCSGPSFTVEDGQTVGAQQLGAGNSGIVMPGGIIDVSAADSNAFGIYACNGNTINNYGDILTSATVANSYFWSAGVHILGNNNEVSNFGTIEASGSGAGLEAYGLYVFGEDNHATNFGLIASSADSDYAYAFGISIAESSSATNLGTIVVTSTSLSETAVDSESLGMTGGNNNTFVNSGAILSTSSSKVGQAPGEGEAYGMAVGSHNFIINSGIMVEKGTSDSSSAYAHGMWTRSFNTILNSGVIEATAVATQDAINSTAEGIFTERFSTVTNSGKISATATAKSATYFDAQGIWGLGNNNITNSGVISASAEGNGAHAYGIRVGYVNVYGNNIVTNTGEIDAVATGENNFGYAIHVNGNDSIVNNCGKLFGSTAAVVLDGTGNTLNLCRGSEIQGLLVLGEGNSLNVDIGSGTNIVLHYEGQPVVSVVGAPHAFANGIVAVLDPSGLSTQDETLDDLTRAIDNAVQSRLSDKRRHYVTESAYIVTPAADVAPQRSSVADIWIAGLGQERNQEGSGSDSGFDSQLAGFIIGLDGSMAPGARTGAFAGGSHSRLETDSDSQQLKMLSAFAGMYASAEMGPHFLDLVLTAGISQQTSERKVYDNMARSGVEHAKADYDSLFISPSVTIGTNFRILDIVLTPSIRGRYATSHIDGYQESGSGADLTVDSRNVDILDLRLQMAFGNIMLLEGGELSSTIRVGADTTWANGNDIEVNVLGTALRFNATGDDDATRAFAGVDLSYDIGRTRLFLNGEVGIEENSTYTSEIAAGFKVEL